MGRRSQNKDVLVYRPASSLSHPEPARNLARILRAMDQRPEISRSIANNRKHKFASRKFAPEEKPSLDELQLTLRQIAGVDREDQYSLALVMGACRKWEAFHKLSSDAERQDELEYFSMFVTEMRSYIREAPEERAILALQDLANLMEINVPRVSFVLADLIYNETRAPEAGPGLQQEAINLLARNHKLLIKASEEGSLLLEQMECLLFAYAFNGFAFQKITNKGIMLDVMPPSIDFKKPAENIATFLFGERWHLLQEPMGQRLFPLVISWAREGKEARLRSLDSELSSIPIDSKEYALSLVALFSHSNIIREYSLYSLMEMGIYSISMDFLTGKGPEPVPWLNYFMKKEFEREYGKMPDLSTPIQ